jgi:adenosylcobalamin-dependent ribonucleoside-triphosphate reductase
LFDVVYIRTYCRWLEDKGRRETWGETVERVVEYSLSLDTSHRGTEEKVREAEALYDKIFHLELFPAGRTLWVGGTSSSRKFPESNFNCTFITIDRLEAYCDMFHMLLCGAGVGFRVLRRDVRKLPLLLPITVIHKDYTPLPEERRLEHTNVWISNCLLPGKQKDVMVIEVGDSKEAWVKSLRYFFDALVAGTPVYLNYDSVRPQGERIKTFGGRAAGPSGLREMFDKVAQIVREADGSPLSPVQALDIANLIALNVVVGGTRRSSQIALGSWDDEEFRDCKVGLWTDPAKKDKKWRVMSNNSLVFDTGEKPTREQLRAIFDRIMDNGEPGFFNLGSAKLRRPKAEGINPCGEILLDDKGTCNLSTVVLSSFVRDGKLDLLEVEKAVRLATRIGVRQTMITMSLGDWDQVQKRDRLTGVSMTGIMDALDALGWRYDSTNARMLFSFLSDASNDEAASYASELRIPRPLLVTTLKPEGTLSQLPTVSSGLHRAYAPFFIRRIRVSSNDPVAKALRVLKVPHQIDPAKSDRIVFEFVVRSSAPISSAEEPALDQLNRYYEMQEHWTDHNSSCTLTFDPEEVPGLIERILEKWDDTVAIALLPKNTTAYPLPPYEAITEEVYNRLLPGQPDTSILADLVNRIERGEYQEGELEESDCASGICPIR